MGELTDISEFSPHLVSEVMCAKCLRRWISVRPEGVWLKDLHCPTCGPGYVINTGQEIDVESGEK